MEGDKSERTGVQEKKKEKKLRAVS